VRFMMLMYPQIETDDPESWSPDAEAVKAMMDYNQKLSEAGVLLALDGLHHGAEGVRVAFSSDGGASVTDGPFTEAKELVGGYWLIQTRSKDEAVEWAKRCPGRDCMIEVRQVQEPEDFSPEAQAVLAEHPVSLGEHAAS
jgi:hypothetical protein